MQAEEVNQEPTIVTLTDEDGQEHDMVLIDVLAIEGQTYVMMAQVEDPETEEDDSQVVVMRREGDLLAPIVDEGEFTRVVAFIEQIYSAQ